MFKKYDIFTLFLIPFYTILLASVTEWTKSNLSVIGNYYNRKSAFFIWGILISFYFYGYISYLFRKVSYKKRAGKYFLFLSMLFVICSVTTPYLPNNFPIKAKFHIFFAFLSPILLACSLLCFLFYLNKIHKEKLKNLWILFIIIILISIFLLLWLGFVSSLLEIFVISSICIYLKLLDVKLTRFF